MAIVGRPISPGHPRSLQSPSGVPKDSVGGEFSYWTILVIVDPGMQTFEESLSCVSNCLYGQVFMEGIVGDIVWSFCYFPETFRWEYL